MGGADKGCSKVWLLRGKAPGANNEVCPWTTLFTNNIHFTKEITKISLSPQSVRHPCVVVMLRSWLNQDFQFTFQYYCLQGWKFGPGLEGGD